MTNDKIVVASTIDGKMNMFGAGSKAAGFGLGDRVIVVTKVADDSVVYAVSMSVLEFETKKRNCQDEHTFKLHQDDQARAALEKALRHAQPAEYPKSGEERTVFSDALQTAEALTAGKGAFTLFFVFETNASGTTKCEQLQADKFGEAAGKIRNSYHWYLGEENSLPYKLDIRLVKRRTDDSGQYEGLSLRNPLAINSMPGATNDDKNMYRQQSMLAAVAEGCPEGATMEFALKVAEKNSTGNVGNKDLDTLGCVCIYILVGV